MPKASPAAARVPHQAEEPKATLSQLTEFVTLMEHGKLGRDYTQDFLRKRLVNPRKLVAPDSTTPKPDDEIVRTVGYIEEAVAQYYPHVVTEIMELLAPFCDPNLDLEFKPYSAGKKYGSPIDTPHGHLFDLKIEKIDVFELRLSGKPGKIMKTGDEGGIDQVVSKTVFADVLKMYELLNTVNVRNAMRIVSETGLHKLIHRRLQETGAIRYGLLRHTYEHPLLAVVESILHALEQAILFTATGDKDKLRRVMAFLEYQRSGHPVYHYENGTVYVLALSVINNER